MTDPAELAATTAAFAAGYAADRERQAYYQEHAGVPIGWDPDPDPWRPPPAGLGYSRPPRADAVYEADKPGLVPHVLPVPLAFDAAAPPSVTGATHGWGLVYAGTGEAPRRSLWSRLTRKGR